MISQEEIRTLARFYGVDPIMIEKDYNIGLLLKFLSQNKLIQKGCIFKGGTGLKKCYFKDFRFSEDLDFTLINRKLNEKNILSEIIDKICQKANKTFGSSLEFFKIELEREEYGQEAYKAVVHFRGLTGISKIDIDFTFYENVELEPNFREIYHTYSDKEDFGHPKIKIYQLEEIAAEKLRAISYIYGYPRNRDIYDVWYLYKNGKLDLVKVSEIFKKKCLFKKIDDTAIKKINSKYLDRFSKYWKAQLGHQLGNLPDFNLVAEDFLSFINDLNL